MASLYRSQFLAIPLVSLKSISRWPGITLVDWEAKQCEDDDKDRKQASSNLAERGHSVAMLV